MITKIIKGALVAVAVCGTAPGFSNSEERVCTKEFCWSKERSDYAQVTTQTASPGMIQNFIRVSGRVAAHPDHVAFVTPKLHGVVTKIYKNIGDRVEADEILAVIESKEVAEAKARYLTAVQRWKFQQALLSKEERLRGISSEEDYVNAEFALQEATLNKDVARHNLYALGMKDQQIETITMGDAASLRVYEIRSPIKGKILDRRLTLGEWVDDEAKVFTLGNFEQVWVEMNVPQNDIQYLSAGLNLNMIGANGKEETLNLSQFHPMISEETRMAKAFAILENNQGKWSPGEFVMVTIQTLQTPASLVVPKEALLNIKGAEYIFVQAGDKFIPSIVRVGKSDGKNVEILSGLQVGDSYAACNTFCLKAEFEKEEGEHNH